MPYALALRQKLGNLSEQMEGIINKCKKEGDRGLTSAEREKFDKLIDQHSDVEASITRAEKSHTISASLAMVNGIVNETGLEEIRDTYRLSPAEKRRKERESDPHAKAFGNYLRLGIDNIATEDKQLLAAKFLSNSDMAATIRNAQSTTGSQGGYAVPQGFSDQLDSAMKWFGGIGGPVGKFTTETGNPLPWPTLNDTSNRGRVIGQNVQVTETDVVFGQVTFNSFIGSSDTILIPLALVQDSYFDMDALITELLGTRLGRLYNWKCTVGSGTAEPNGIVTAAVAAGNILQFPTGNTTALGYTNLVDLEHSVDPAYRYNDGTAWMFSDAMLKVIKKLVDGNNRPLWQSGLTASFQDGAGVSIDGSRPKILDHPYLINQDMAVPAASAYSILFGDMSKFKVREVAGGTTVLRLVERYADYLQQGYIGFRRFDSQLLDAGTHPIVVGQQSAS